VNISLEFKWKLKPTVTCTINNTDESCEEYMSNVPTDTESCKVDVVYGYKVENIGSKCESITSVDATIDATEELAIPASNWPVPNWNFCPGDTADLRDERDQEDLCDMAGKEIGVNVALNDNDGSPGEASFLFSTPNTITLPPVSS
jgi:hypothetical protein